MFSLISASFFFYVFLLLSNLLFELYQTRLACARRRGVGQLENGKRLAGVSPVYVFVCVFCVVFLKISGFDVGSDDKIALSTKSNAYHGSLWGSRGRQRVLGADSATASVSVRASGSACQSNEADFRE